MDERSGVLGLEKIEGWSIREVLGGGAEGEGEDDGEGEGEYVDPKEAEEVVKELSEVKSQGMEALERIGVTKGERYHQVVSSKRTSRSITSVGQRY